MSEAKAVPLLSETRPVPADVASDLRVLLDRMLAVEAQHRAVLDTVAPSNSASARNLLHYLGMRQVDLRSLQTQLSSLGLSSIGRAESHALSAVQSVASVVNRLNDTEPLSEVPTPCDLKTGTKLLEVNTSKLFGAKSGPRAVRVMLTMPSEAAQDAALVRSLLDAGMDCMRINCAHDDREAWARMVEHLRRARDETHRHCSVQMDLAGPKLRTGDLEPGPAVIKVRPIRDALGRVTSPAMVWLTSKFAPAPAPSGAAGCVLHVNAEWLARLARGDEVRFRDTRGRRRTIQVVDTDLNGAWAELHRTAYLVNGLTLHRGSSHQRKGSKTRIQGIPPTRGSIHLRVGDLLVLTREPTPGRGATHDSTGRLLSPPRISCSLFEAFEAVKAGERICLDDGKIVGVAEATSDSEIHVRILRTPPGGAKLGADKGINLPETKLGLPSLTTKDQEDLEFVVRNADLVGLSFINHEDDVRALISAISRLDAVDIGIVLKIETQRALGRLPAILLASMAHERVGVMIARGDLAIEVGYERLAEAQEEILWLCEAAHRPAIWATQVLESLTKYGTATRAEITDAAMGHRAECVMLNKGPHIEEAVTVLNDILGRMDSHQSKKSAKLRALQLAKSFGC